MPVIRMAQYGTKHGHAAGKLTSMLNNPQVEVAGVYEPDTERRAALAHADGPFRHIHWFNDKRDMLDDASIVAVASEGLNEESLSQTEEVVRAGKHVWYDKPAGDDWIQWQRVVALARESQRHIQMGYMFRYHDGFGKIATWVKSGMLGEIFAVRAHMSTDIPEASREVISVHRGGIFYDLSGHMLDQVVWLLGRPNKVTSFLHNDTGVVPAFMDNTLGVFEYDAAIAVVDIAAMEPGPTARRFEVYGTQGSAILLEPFEPGTRLRLVLSEAHSGYTAGEQIITPEARGRQTLYDIELDAFLATIRGEQTPDRSLDHELLVQETILRGTGEIPE